MQWIRICLTLQGIRVQPLVWEDSTCCRAVKPMRRNPWAWVRNNWSLLALEPHITTTEPACCNCWSPCIKRLGSTREATPMRSPHTTRKRSAHLPQLEKACLQQWRPSAAKRKMVTCRVENKAKYLKLFFDLFLNGQYWSNKISALVKW